MSNVGKIVKAEADNSHIKDFGTKYIVNVNLCIDKVPFEFDTGAELTYVPYDLLSKSYKLLFPELLKHKFTYFYSASGDAMKVYACKLRDIYVGRIRIKDFYFYVGAPPNKVSATKNNKKKMKRKTALLGRDFSEYCDYTHDSSLGKVEINDFDEEAYIKNARISASMLGIASDIDVLDISSLSIDTSTLTADLADIGLDSIILTDEDERVKDVAASFRDFYGNKFPNIKDNN